MPGLSIGSYGAGVDLLALKQKGPSLCSVTCLASVCRYWGVENDPYEIQKYLGEIPEGGYTLMQLRDWARNNGLIAFVYKGTLEDLKNQTAKGRPVIVTFKSNSTANHSVVVRQVTEKGDVMVMNPAKGRTTPIAKDTFLSRWNAIGSPTLLIARQANE